MRWYKVGMSASDVTNGSAMRLQNTFSDLFMRLGGPEEAGMFSGLSVVRNDYFFSPKAVRIASAIIAAYAGIECDAPKRSEVAMLVVNRGAEAVPFASE